MKKLQIPLFLILLIFMAVACQLPFLSRRPKPAAEMRITESQEVTITDASIMDRSPDGRWLIVYTLADPPDNQFCIYASEDLSPVFCMPEKNEMGIMLQPVSWSPDSGRLAFVERMPNIPIDTDIWILTIETAHLENITEDNVSGILSADMENIPFLDNAPAWSPDGIWITFARTIFDDASLSYKTTLYKIPALGGEAERIIKVSEEPVAVKNGMLAWLADERLIYTLSGDQNNGTAGGLYAVPASGESPPQALEILGKETVSSHLLTTSPDSAYALLLHQIQIGASDIVAQIMLCNLETGHNTPLKELAPNDIPTWFSRSNWATFSPDSSKIAYFYESETPTAQWRLALTDIVDNGSNAEVVLKTFDSRKYFINYPFRWGQDDTLMIRLVEKDPPFHIQLLTVK